jgi:cholesterol transport system auxiliary component
MTSLLSRRGVLVAAWCIVPLAGCSVLPNPPVAQIYRLSPTVDDPPPGPVLRKRLVVEIPTASESLDTDRIALIRDRTRFDYYANSLWTDRVPLLVQGLLIDALENDGSIAEIARDASNMTPDYVLQTEIREFEARYTGTGDQPPNAVVALDLSLVKMPERRMIGRTLVTETAPATRNSLDGVVEAFDAAIGKALAQSVAWTTRTIGPAA